MGRETETNRPDALGAIAHLARSDNRITVLESLTEGPYGPTELAEITDASRPTLGRILTEFEKREWAERTPDGYRVTPAGRHVASEFRTHMGAMEAIQRLGDAVDWIPTEEHPIGLHHFREATLQFPGGDDPVETTDYVAGLLEDASTWYALTHLVAPELKLDVMLEGVRSGRLDSKLVLAADLIEYLADKPARRDWLRNYVDAGAAVYRYGEPLPCNLLVIDDLVLIGKTHPEGGHPYRAITTENEAVRSWAESVIDHYGSAAKPIEPDTLSA